MAAFVSNCGACITAFLGAWFPALDHLIPSWLFAGHYELGLATPSPSASIVPFCLIYVLPGVRRFAGYSIVARPQSAPYTQRADMNSTDSGGHWNRCCLR